MFVPDNNGLNRFKSGFFVDNFTSFQAQETGAGIKNSLDIQEKELIEESITKIRDKVKPTLH